jgi:hypothetical protein
VTDIYSQKAKAFYDQYQSLTFEQVHQEWLSFLGDQSGLALDVGAGSNHERQFFCEAEAALPLIGERLTVDSVFDGMLQQRLRLKTNLQLAEWLGG